MERNRATSDDGEMCRSNLLQCPVQVSLNYWLSRFVVGARREDGQPYYFKFVGWFAQKEAVSGILVQGKRSFAEQVDKENAGGSCSIAGSSM